MLGFWLFRLVPGKGKQTERFISNGSEGTFTQIPLVTLLIIFSGENLI